MSKKLFCTVLNAEGEAFSTPPYPGPLGQRIQASVSKQGWQRWLEHQTRLINEYRLSPLDDKTTTFLESEMEKFFFGEGSDNPDGYIPEGGAPD